jgi:SAM-dependent methyltransferase
VCTFKSDREREHFDLLAEKSGNVWWGSTTRAGQLRLEQRASLAIQCGRLSPRKLVLEPGAGSGEFTRRLAVSGATIIGVEISPRQVEIANRRLMNYPHVRVVEGDISELDFPNATFDAVVGNAVLHHLDLKAALPEIRRVLKIGGSFFFTEPNMLNPQIVFEKNVRFIGRILENSADETAFFRWRIKATLERHGFRCVWTRPFDFLHPGTPDRLIPFIRRMNRVLNNLPIISEFGGSLQISAKG